MAPFHTADIPPYYRDDLTQEDKQVIGDWVKNSIPINKALRLGKDDKFFKTKPDLYEESIDKAIILSAVIERSKLEQEYNVSRGLGSYDINKVKDTVEARKKTGVSTFVEDDGFTAVSYQNKIALEYAEPDTNGEKYLIVSKLHRGDKALFIGNENPIYDRKEGEILLQKNTGYYITGEKTIITDNNEIVHLIEVVYRGIR
ncbi:MAG: hypothetical protein JXA44_00020 [Methanospirillaceae archaeon]|nr:hypothetical protein [Methanospirillaceae archaeon]